MSKDWVWAAPAICRAPASVGGGLSAPLRALARAAGCRPMRRCLQNGIYALATLLTAASSAACDRGANRQAAAPSVTTSARAVPSGWDAFVDSYLESYFVANPTFAVAQGRHEFDGRLPDWSRAGIQAQIARLEAARATTLAFADAVLSPEQRFQRAYVLSRIDADLFWLRDASQPFSNPAFYFDAGLDPGIYVSLPYAPAEQRMRAFIRYALAVPVAVQQIRANLHTPLPATFVEYGSAGFNGFAQFYRGTVPKAFAEVSDAALQRELASAIEIAARAMTELAKWIESRPARADAAYVLGAERFRAMLQKTEAVTTPLAELEAIGRADLARNRATLELACQSYLPKGTLAACVAKQAADKPEGGPVDGARKQLAQLRQYIVDHRIVSIPSDEDARVELAPPYKRQNFAYIEIPGPYEAKLPSTYYIAPPDPSWSKAEQAAYVPGKADLLFTSVHEVWPGHFLQFLHSNRAAWRFGQLFVGYAFAEGWAHYAEELLVEEGIAAAAPELQIGQSLNALLRDVRFLCAIGLHTQGMSVERCEQMFKEQAFQDAGNARQQASRGTYDPGYLNYTLGKLMIRKLRADWLRENPGRSRGQFHDLLLSFGGPPIPLLRAKLLAHPADALF
jgi:uncharacterized protein (DUF885 family)